MSAEDFANMVFDKIDINGDGKTQKLNHLTTANYSLNVNLCQYDAALKDLSSVCMFVFISQVNCPMKSSWRGFRMTKCC